MTQEEKQLLLKDLCARLPYGVKIHINSCIEEQNQMQLYDVTLEGETIGVKNEKWAFRAIPIIDDEDETKVIRPYLRPMSSMTDAEKEEYSNTFVYKDGFKMATSNSVDFLNSHYIDYRGLIPMNLALEAPEDMYKNE